jgi:hypothetical protein
MKAKVKEKDLEKSIQTFNDLIKPFQSDLPEIRINIIKNILKYFSEVQKRNIFEYLNRKNALEATFITAYIEKCQPYMLEEFFNLISEKGPINNEISQIYETRLQKYNENLLKNIECNKSFKKNNEDTLQKNKQSKPKKSKKKYDINTLEKLF